ncbi:MAG: helicase [Flavobacterium sp.]|nr:MAG: helicase [Flavobacterium sp.]
MKLELRPHQNKIINALRRDWKKYRTHMIQAPTGAGKTAIAAMIIDGFLTRGMRVLFLAPYQMLVMQTAIRFIDYGLEKPGIVWQRHEWTDPAKPLQVGTVQSQVRRQMPKVDLIIIDEAHIKNKKMLEIIDNAECHVIGLSGTPYSEWLGAHYENLIKEVTTRELIDTGYLSDFEIYAPTTPDLKGVRTSKLNDYGEDYVESQIAEIMGDSKVVGDIITTWLEKGENEPTIAFCCNVSHANYLTVQFNRSGVKTEVMTADTPPDERQQITGRFEDGITKIICNVGVLVAGFDSDVRCIIYARPTKSEIRWIQCLGRGLRTAPGKKRLIILDHSGTVHRLGFPDQIEYNELPSENDGLDEVSAKRKEKEKKEKLPKECISCHFMKDAGVLVCPVCGFRAMTGDNVEADETRELSALKKTKVTKVDKQQFYSELLGAQSQSRMSKKFMSDGYISQLYRQKFGVFPRSLIKSIIPPSVKTLGFIKSRQIAYAKRKAR